MPTRILLLGPISPETLAALESLPGGVTILPPADSHTLLTRVTTEQPDLIVEGSHAVDWAGSSNFFHQALDSEFARAVRYRHPLSLMIAAIDGMESMASTHGSGSIETFQAALSQALRRSLRQIDVLAATASGEFALLLPETTAAGARIVAERARALASRLLVKGEAGGDRKSLPVKTTVSVGVVDAPREAFVSAGDLLAAARAGAARAASAGGDRVELV